MSSYCLDANCLIEPWKELYLKDVFPSLWQELSKDKGKIILIEPIYKEIDPISDYHKKNFTQSEIEIEYPLNTWIKKNLNSSIKTKSKTKLEALQLEKKYEIDEKSKGVSQNDIILIAYAKINKKEVVTLEKDQTKNPPNKKKNYKIPLICKEEEVSCINLIEMFKQLKIKI